MKKVQLQVKEYMSEKLEDILNSLTYKDGDFIKQMVLYKGNMKIGKTHFQTESIYLKLIEKKIQPVLIVPTISLMESVENRLKEKKMKINKCKEHVKAKIDKELNLVVTTPESLKHVVEECSILNQQFLILYDEVHMAWDQCLFRKEMNSAFKFYKHKLCMGLYGFTATAEGIDYLPVWDQVITVTPVEKFKQADLMEIQYNFKYNLKNLVGLILDNFYKNDKKCRIIDVINDVDLINAAAKELRKKGIKVFTWYSNMEDQESLEIYHKALKKEKIDYDVLLTTCLCEVGVEIFHKKEREVPEEILKVQGIPTILSLHVTPTYNINSIPQTIGRFREGISKVIVTMGSEIKTDYVINNRQFFLNETIKIAENMYSLMRLSNKAIIQNWVIKNDNGEQELNQFSIEKTAYELYYGQYYNNPIAFKDYMDNLETLCIEKSILVEAKDYSIEVEKVEKKDKKEIERIQKETIEQIKPLNNEEIVTMLINPYQDLPKEYEYLIPVRNNYYSEAMEGIRKDIENSATILGRTKPNMVKNFAHLPYDTIKNIVKNNHIITASTYYEVYRQRPSRELKRMIKEYEPTAYIRIGMEELFGKEKDVRLGKDNKEKLFEYLKNEKKYLPKLTANSLDKYLNIIYIFRDTNRILKVRIY